jgi:hypothetical protein
MLWSRGQGSDFHSGFKKNLLARRIYVVNIKCCV